MCHRILSYLLWYSTMVSVGRSVSSYVCVDLLSTREGSPSKGGFICTPLPPSGSATVIATLAARIWLLYHRDRVIFWLQGLNKSQKGTRHQEAAFLFTSALRFPYFRFRTSVSALQCFPLARYSEINSDSIIPLQTSIVGVQ